MVPVCADRKRSKDVFGIQCEGPLGSEGAMAVYVEGVVGILVFYVAVLGVGIWAGTKQKNSGEEEVMLAGRSLGLTVGVITMIATWVGGGYINGTAEALFSTGLVWCQVPVGYSLSLLFGVLLFVKQMRRAEYVTMLDPFQRKYGSRVGGLMFVPAVCGDLFWVGAIFNALGSSLVVILGLDSTTSVIVSAVFAASYTMVGGLYSVTYTDVLQLACIVFGLVLSAPFAYHHSAVNHETVKKVDWIGTIERKDLAEWIDSMLLLIFGGIPWQGYFQRILSMRTVRQAQVLSVFAMFGCFFMAFPPALFGVVAKSTNWTEVEGFGREITDDDKAIILPLTLRYLTPGWVSFFGLGAISAAVMSSADSSILSSSSMFSRNIYKLAIRPKLLLVTHWEGANTYGCLFSFVAGIVLRLLGGEPGLGIPAAIKYPWYDEEAQVQKFPFRTLTMLCALAAHLLCSWGTRQLFQRRLLPDSWDFLQVFSAPPKGAEGPKVAQTPLPTLALAAEKPRAPTQGDRLPLAEDGGAHSPDGGLFFSFATADLLVSGEISSDLPFSINRRWTKVALVFSG
ncbi:High-affinity choline transporter 1 [Gryllus bimaculatus]|nr:High-affinity choline transporter 1 [Gryllus bimaculatus]